MFVICLNCGTGFEKSVGAVKQSPNHFCTRSCAATYNNQKTPKRQPEGKCRVCQKPAPTKTLLCSEACQEQEKRKREADRIALAQKTVANRGARVVAWRQRLKIKAVALMGGSCQICGYDRSVRALTFHHLDPSQKDFSISKRVKSWDRVQEELKKCLLLCCRCHAEVHEELIDISVAADPATIKRRAIKQQALEYLGGQCFICGYRESTLSMDFHHLDPSQKEFNIARVTRSWERVRPELDKCVLLCNRCHAELNSDLIQLPELPLGSGGGDRTPDQAITPIP